LAAVSIAVDIPGGPALKLDHLLLDQNGTLTDRGLLIDGVASRLSRLRPRLDVHVLSADTFGTPAELSEALGVQARRVSTGAEKEAFLASLGAERCAVIGNGNNDVPMLRDAALAIAVIGPEGASATALAAADVICASITDALELLLDERALAAASRHVSMQCGPVRHTVCTGAPPQSASRELRLTPIETGSSASILPREASIQEIYGALATNGERLTLVASDARRLMSEGRAAIMLTERREHLERLVDALRDDVAHLVVLHGGVKPRARREALAHLAALPLDEPRLVLATGRYIGEGFDDPRLDTLVLTMPIAWKGTVVQYVGRLHRAHPAKRDIRIYDYVDTDVPVLRRMYAKRLRAYQHMGYTTSGQLAVDLDATTID
jgi:soluble P-type ATPase